MNAKWAKNLDGQLWKTLNKYLIPSALFYLHEKYNGGNNEHWRDVMKVVENRQWLNDDALHDLQRGVYGREES